MTSAAEPGLRLVGRSVDRLGEGPCWSAEEGRLYWFDIKEARLRWHEPAAGAYGEVVLPWRASAAAPRRAGGLLLATERGLATFDPSSQRTAIVEPIALEPGFRTNDGRLDPQGCFWWSTMDDAGGARPGAIYVTRPGAPSERVIDGIHIANSLAVSADGRTLYLADSRLRTIFAYDTSDLSKRTVFVETMGEGTPDGSTLDLQGFLWSAVWGGQRLARHAPDGRVDRTVPMPVSQPTCCTFGGADLATLYVTSAWEGLSDAERVRQPLAGRLFAFEPGVRGLPAPPFDG